jgi:hypothetical protein
MSRPFDLTSVAVVVELVLEEVIVGVMVVAVGLVVAVGVVIVIV